MATASSTPAQLSPAPSIVSSRPGTPNLSTPPTVPADNKIQDESSKLKLFLSLLRKYVTNAEAIRSRSGRDRYTGAGLQAD